MRILTVDVGTGTQDILLFDSDRELENCFKLVMPSPTVVVADRIRDITRRQGRLLLTGATMGGGPSQWAARDHAQAGFDTFATPDAARTFDDDLDMVAKMGIRVVSEDEAVRVRQSPDVTEVVLRDFWLDLIGETFRSFGVETGFDAIAVAVFDHGAAPPGYSDRVFRFDYLRERLSSGIGMGGFAFDREHVPASMTRLRAVAESATDDIPMLLMDTAPAAVLGAIEDPSVRRAPSATVANVGNFHCLAFHLAEGEVAGLFEHHTGELTPQRLRHYVEALGRGDINNDEVFSDKGHGALVRMPDAPAPELLAVTGPRRQLLVETGLNPYLAVPHGDMMLAGNFGLLRAYATHDAHVREAVDRRLGPNDLV